jgi:hypothetical protein
MSAKYYPSAGSCDGGSTYEITVSLEQVVISFDSPHGIHNRRPQFWISLLHQLSPCSTAVWSQFSSQLELIGKD